MPCKFKTTDYITTLKLNVNLEDAVPPNHLVRFIVNVIAQLDLSALYPRYGKRGSEVIAPEVLLRVLFYEYVTGVFSLRKLEKATSESLLFRFVAGDLHPDYDTLANFRKTFLLELKDESRIMKNSTYNGFDQHYNAQAAGESFANVVYLTPDYFVEPPSGY